MQIRLAFEEGQERFARSWERIAAAPRVVVHVPSLSLSAARRGVLPKLSVRQNMQMSRLCDLHHPDVDVVYCAPFPLNDDLKGCVV